VRRATNDSNAWRDVSKSAASRVSGSTRARYASADSPRAGSSARMRPPTETIAAASSRRWRVRARVSMTR
jgi:hypothetical protein